MLTRYPIAVNCQFENTHLFKVFGNALPKSNDDQDYKDFSGLQEFSEILEPVFLTLNHDYATWESKLYMSGVLNIHEGYVFIHVPKCAGASITSVLMESEYSKNFKDIPRLETIVKAENAVSAEVVDLTLHARARDIRLFLGGDLYESLESFAVVRNPWERLKSRYHFFKRIRHHPTHQFAKGSLGDFVYWACENNPSTMHERLADRFGNVIVKNILKYESLQSDFRRMSQVLPMNIDKLPHINVSSNSREPYCFPRCVVDMVKRTYEKDFSFFGYPIDPPDQ